MQLNFKDWKITTKLLSSSLLSIVLLLAAMLLYMMPAIEKKMVNEKKESLKKLVEVSYSVAAEYDARVKEDGMPIEAAKKEVLRVLGTMRYGADDYVWVNDMEPKMIMHPFFPREKKPEWYGSNGLVDYVDPYGTKIFMEFVKLCRDNGEGGIQYFWTKPGKENMKPFPKMAYIKLYKPWGWVIGTGIYIDDVTASMKQLRWMIVSVTLVLGVLILLTTTFISSLIARPIRRVVDMIKDIAEGEGDLRKRLAVNSKDEVGELAQWFNVFVDKLHDIIYQLSVSIAQIASATDELSATSEEMAAGAEEQTSQTAEVASSMEEMSTTVQEVAKNSSVASNKAKIAGEAAVSGGTVVNQVVSGMDKIAESVRQLELVISGLSKNSEKIGDIVGVIDDVADQTNLLAFNAAIEAARAGDQGRGFAVVADEVRKLAERTSASTKEIAMMVKTIQGDTGKAVDSMKVSDREVESGVKLALQAGGSLTEIVNSAKDAQEMIQHIATASEEQSAAAEEISANVESISSVSKQNASAAQQTSAAAQEISRLTNELQQMVQRFKLRKDVEVADKGHKK